MTVPETGEAAGRRDWRDTFALAADLALAGIAVSALLVPVVTAGAAIRTASAAVHHRLSLGSWPSLGESWALFRRSFWRGAVVSLLLAATVYLVALDIALVASGRVPGGAVMLGLTVVVALVLVGLAAVVVVEVGSAPAGWRAAVASGVRRSLADPLLVPAMLGTLVVPCVLAYLIPVTAPIALGFTIFALHVASTRPREKQGRPVNAFRGKGTPC